MILNKINGKKYIGQTRNLEIRWEIGHKKSLNKNKHFNSHLQQSWNKYGGKNFEFVVIRIFQNYRQDLLDRYEDYWIQFYDTLDSKKGYNKRRGGSNGTLGIEARKKLSEKAKLRIGEKNPFYGKSHTEETIEKIRKANINRPKEIHGFYRKNHSIETKNKLSEKAKLKIGEKNPFYGKSHAEETKKKIGKASEGRQSFLGRKHSEESKKKMSESHKDVPLSLETRRKISESNKGRTVTEETRKKISEGNKNKIVSKETREKQRIAHKGKKLSESHKKSLSLAGTGENNPSAKLTNDIVLIIADEIREGKPLKELSKKFNISITTLQRIRNGATWTHITGGPIIIEKS